MPLHEAHFFQLSGCPTAKFGPPDVAVSLIRCSSLDHCYCNLSATASFVTRLGHEVQLSTEWGLNQWPFDLYETSSPTESLSPPKQWRKISDSWEKPFLVSPSFLKINTLIRNYITRQWKEFSILVNCKVRSRSPMFSLTRSYSQDSYVRCCI